MDKKCIVLDLDNTLWGGVVGEDGLDGISLSLNPPGNSFLAFQQALLDHYNRGVILAINSRNNQNDALEVLRKHPNMILKEKHFAANRINWNDKVENMKELAKELNIGLDSMVFLDDDITNRSLMRTMLPEVETPELPSDPEKYVSFLSSLKFFQNIALTDEDKMRGNLYVTERLRKEEEKNFRNKKNFLKNLKLELFIYEDNDSHLSRLSQLTEKTNQFNVSKKPFSEKEIKKFIQSPAHSVFHARLQDKFGDYGIIAFVLVSRKKLVWQIESFLMSCRVFGRGVEEALLAFILKRAKVGKAAQIKITFTKSPKNMPAKVFIDRFFKSKNFNFKKKLITPFWIKTYYEKF